MHCRTLATIGALACALTATACTTDRNGEVRDTTTVKDAVKDAAGQTAREADRIADAQRARVKDMADVDEKFAALQRDFDQKFAARPRGTSGSAAAGRLGHEINDEINDLKQAVNDLKTTTADNWWDRHERALKHAADDIDADVQRMAGRAAAARSTVDQKVNAAGEAVSTAPFNSRRDRFVADLQARIDGWKASLDKVKAKGARETELENLKARVNKLDDDVDHLKSAKADDWWDLSKARVNDYIERMEKSVARLDDDRR